VRVAGDVPVAVLPRDEQVRQDGVAAAGGDGGVARVVQLEVLVGERPLRLQQEALGEVCRGGVVVEAVNLELDVEPAVRLPSFPASSLGFTTLPSSRYVICTFQGSLVSLPRLPW
jgi:hypothetical protein